MKTIRLCLFMYFFCCFSFLFAQEDLDLGNGMLFPQFESGTVVLKNRMQSSVLINYNLLQQEMLFQDTDSVIQTFADALDVLVVIVGKRRFFPISSGGMFYEEIQAGKGSFFIQHKANMLSEGKASAYGGYSQTSSITSYSSLSSSSTGTVYKLNIDEKFRIKKDNFYYLQIGKSYKRFNSAKSLGKLFKGKGLQIEEFAKEQSVNFNNIDDITRIVEYGYSL